MTNYQESSLYYWDKTPLTIYFDLLTPIQNLWLLSGTASTETVVKNLFSCLNISCFSTPHLYSFFSVISVSGLAILL